MQPPCDEDASVLQQKIEEHKVCVLGGCSACVSVWWRANGFATFQDKDTPTGINHSDKGRFQMSVPTLTSGPLPLLCLLDLFLLSSSLPPTTFPSLSLPFPLHPFPLPPPFLPSHSLAPSLCSSFFPCPLPLSPFQSSSSISPPSFPSPSFLRLSTMR